MSREIPLEADVLCPDGPAGKSTYVIFNPLTGLITHVVVYDGDFPEETERVVPVDRIADTTHDSIRLDCSLHQLRDMEPFRQVHFLPREGEPEYVGTALAWPWARPEGRLLPLETESIPVGELALHRGAHVEATDGRVGQVEEFLVADDGHATHLVLEKGHLLGRRRIAVPLSAVAHTEEDVVYLKVDQATVDAMPNHTPDSDDS